MMYIFLLYLCKKNPNCQNINLTKHILPVINDPFCVGMIGELVRREAEIAIAPLTINSQREQVNTIFYSSRI